MTESMTEYLADADGPSLSSHIAHLLVARSPLHAWHAHPKLNPYWKSEESGEFDYGTAAHALLLEEDRSSLVVVESADWRNKEARQARETARAEGKTPILKRQLAKVEQMVLAARAAVESSTLAGIFARGKPEVVLRWEDRGVKCRMRADWLADDYAVILDYKTTFNAEPSAFIRTAIGCGYDYQEALYRRGVKAKTGKTPMFVFLAQEKEPPFACSLVAFDPAMREMADRKVDFAITLWGSCIAKNQWNGYPKDIAHAEPPAWYAAEAEAIDFDNLDERMNP